MLTDRRTDGQPDRQTDRHHQSISRNCFAIRPKMLLAISKLTIIHLQQGMFVKHRCPQRQQSPKQLFFKTKLGHLCPLPQHMRTGLTFKRLTWISSTYQGLSTYQVEASEAKQSWFIHCTSCGRPTYSPIYMCKAIFSSFIERGRGDIYSVHVYFQLSWPKQKGGLWLSWRNASK